MSDSLDVWLLRFADSIARESVARAAVAVTGETGDPNWPGTLIERWHYGDAPRMTPWDPHVRIDGVEQPEGRPWPSHEPDGRITTHPGQHRGDKCVVVLGGVDTEIAATRATGRMPRAEVLFRVGPPLDSPDSSGRAETRDWRYRAQRMLRSQSLVPIPDPRNVATGKSAALIERAVLSAV